MKNYKSIHEVICCEELSEIEKVQIEFHSDNFNGLETALKHYQNVEIYEGSAIDYAAELFNELYGLYGLDDFSDSVAPYIDYKAYCNDLISSGDIFEFNHKYLITNVNDI